jgi:hypothetical protein
VTRLSRTSGVCPIDRELSSYQCGIFSPPAFELVDLYYLLN